MNTGIRIGLIGGILAVSLSGAGTFKENIKEPGNAFAGAYAEEAESDFFVRKIEDSSFNVQGTADSDISGRETANAAAVVKKIDGKWYYLLDGKIQKCGWATVGGKKYYFNKTTGAALTGVRTISGYTYVFGASDAVMKKSCYYKNAAGLRFYLLSNGRAAKGLYTYTTGGAEYISYFNGDGTVKVSELWKMDDEKWYYFKSNGNAAVGGRFKTADGKVLYANADGTLIHKGWTTIGGKKYYFSKNNSSAFLGIKTISGYTYYFDKNGVLQTDLYYQTDDGLQYYFKSNGRAAVGAATYKNKAGTTVISFFNGDGTIIKEGFGESDGKLYYLKASGYAATDSLFKLPADGKYYLAGKDGVISRDGLKWYNSELYYFDTVTGAASVGIKSVNGDYYVFGKDGKAYRNQVRHEGEKYFKLDENGVAQAGFIESGDYLIFCNKNGTIKKDCIFTYQGKTYCASASGIIRRTGYFKYNISDTEYKLFYFDETTGAAITGFKIGTFLGVEGRGMFFDPKEATGYRTGFQNYNGATYILDKRGVAQAGFYSDDENKKLYYCNEQNYKLVKGQTKFTFANVEFPMNTDGSLEYLQAKALSTDKNSVVLAIGFTQMYKPVIKNAAPLGTDLSEVNGYTCTAFIGHVYYNAGINIGLQDIVPTCIKKGFAMNDNCTAAGDIVFWNLTNCDSKTDEAGDPWLIDLDNDGKCDRIHKPNEFEDGRTYHVHHVALALGNGQALEAAAGRGVVIRTMPEPSDTYYPVAYGHWDGN